MGARIVLNYANLGHAEFVSKSLGMVNGLRDNPHFPLPWPDEFPSLAKLATAQDAYSLSVVGAADRDKAKVAAQNAKRLVLEDIVREIGRYVQTKSGGDRAILETTGYDLARTREKNPDVPHAPEELRLKLGRMPGSIIASAKKTRGATAFITEYCMGNPNVEANWRPGAMTSGCRKVELTGLSRGQDYTVRMRGIGRKGPGPWSNIEMIMPV